METYPTWIRLHPESTDDTMAVSVEARIHDPLWMLGRQWQFGELQHDGGATPVDVRIEGRSGSLARLRGGTTPSAGGSLPIDPAGTPLETLVEREAVSESGLDNLRLRAEAGRQLLRMLNAAGLDGRRSFWIGESPFVRPAVEPDEPTRAWLDLVEGRVPDGAGLALAIPARLADGAAPVPPEEKVVLSAWLAWSGSRFDQPPSGPSTWDPEHLEYAFAAAGSSASGEAVLVAPEYVDGRLEWYDFEQAPGSLGAAGEATVRRAFRIPAPLEFAGMPNPRFWTFEDPGVRFDLLDALRNAEQPPSPAMLLVLDFALSYSDDWFLVPLALPAWSIFESTAVVVTDVFGDSRQASPPAGRWNMFRLDATAPSAGLSPLYLVAAPAEATDGPAIEEVHFLADEVANVAWAVERLAEHPLGHGAAPVPIVAAAEHGRASGLTWTLVPPPPPGNWFPLLPLQVGRLALGSLWNAPGQLPAGRVLAELPLPRLLHQEEVPPEGAQVVRRWQSARALDGSVRFWIGRSKTPRRTEIAPAVRFDVVAWK